MFIRNCWYVACWDYEIEPGAVFSRSIIDEPIVLFRDSEGRVAALEDRCCHRAAPLSLGRVVDDSLQCMYHGLRFAGDGRCVEVPGQSTIPERACVRSYPVVERANWVWVWMGDPALADPALVPEGVIPLDDPGWNYKTGYLNIEANYLLVSDNALDFSHITYVHPTTFGGTDKWATERPKIERLENGVRVTRWLLDVAPPPYLPKFKNFTGNIDRFSTYDWLVPGLLLLHSDMYPAGSDRDDPNNLIFTYTSSSVLTPETARSSHYMFRWGPQSHENPAIADILKEAAVLGFAEDKEIMEAQQRVLDRAPDSKMIAISHDAGLIQMRRVYEQHMRAEQMPAAAE